MAELTTFGQMSNSMTEPATEPTLQELVVSATTPVTTTTNPVEPAIITTTEAAPSSTEDTVKDSSEFSLSLGADAPATPAVTSTQTPAPAPTFNWQDEIKKVDRNELITQLGIDPFAIEIDKHIKGGGQPIDYLQARAVDYNKVSDEDIVKSDLRKQFPGFPASDIDKLFSRKYPELDSDIVAEKEEAELQLRADAYTTRQLKIADQQKFKISDTPIPQKDEAYEQWKQNRENQPQLIEQARNYFTGHEATKALSESKRVTINLGEGIAPFNFNVTNPELITQNLTDGGETWSKLTNTATGEPDVPKQQLITLFAFNPQRFMQDIFNYGMQMGLRKEMTSGQNAQKPQAIVTTMSGDAKQTVTVRKFGDISRQ